MPAAVVAACKGRAAPDVLAFAGRWAAQARRPLSVVTVYPGIAPLGRGRVDGEWVAWNREQAQRILAEARESVAQAADFRAVAAESAPRGLHETMEAEPGALMVLGSRDARGARRTAPGSTAERLLTGAPGPVALVPWDYEELPETSLARVAVAFVDTPDGRAALESARAMAAELGAALQLVSVLPDTLVRPSLGEPLRFAAAQREDFEAAVRDAAREGEQVRVLEGPVVDALSDLRPDEVDVLVCGSRGYGPARRVLLGGVSARLLRRARVPVVVVPRP